MLHPADIQQDLSIQMRDLALELHQLVPRFWVPEVQPSASIRPTPAVPLGNSSPDDETSNFRTISSLTTWHFITEHSRNLFKRDTGWGAEKSSHFPPSPVFPGFALQTIQALFYPRKKYEVSSFHRLTALLNEL